MKSFYFNGSNKYAVNRMSHRKEFYLMSINYIHPKKLAIKYCYLVPSKNHLHLFKWSFLIPFIRAGMAKISDLNRNTGRVFKISKSKETRVGVAEVAKIFWNSV